MTQRTASILLLLVAGIPCLRSIAGQGGLNGARSSAASAAPALTHSIAVAAGWNLISLPVRIDAPVKDSLFPTAISPAFHFSNGYTAAATLDGAMGFWLKFPAPETIAVAGAGRFNDTVALRKGWNLVGGISTTVAAGNIVTIPPGLVASGYFRFTPDSGYSGADTLRPGRGYWVKASGPGTLLLRSQDVPCPGIPAVEYEGNTYHTVQVCDQCWLRENLNVGEWNWGGIPQEDNGLAEKYCFNDELINCTYYGALYQWGEAMQYATEPGSRGLCPPGWHIPTLGEFLMLEDATGGDANAIKALRQGTGSGAGTNTTGFSALLGGYRHLTGTFSITGYQTYFWTSTEKSSTATHSLYLFYNYSDYYFNNIDKGYGVSIRCIRD